MRFIHVVTRFNRLPLFTQEKSPLWLTLQIHSPLLLLQSCSGKHLPRHLIDKHIGAKGSCLLRLWQRQTQLDRLLQFHPI